MQHIVVLAGGDSEERAVSLRSGAAVAKALEATGYRASLIDPQNGLEQILSQLNDATAVFIALHGKNGEDGVPQRFLEQHNIPYTGSDSKASALCFDKAAYINTLQQHAILTPQTELIDYQGLLNSNLAQKPYVLKPNDGGSSIDTFIVRDMATADTEAIKNAFTSHGKLLLQNLISGIEITIPILGDKSLSVIEIIPPPNQEFDYENKYNDATQELCPPTNVSQELQVQAQRISEQIHVLTGCRDMSRTDMIIQDGKLYTLETNTIPGLTPQSLLPKAAAEAGMNMSQVCQLLVERAIARAKR